MMMVAMIPVLVVQQDLAIQDAIVLVLHPQIHKPMEMERIVTMDRCMALIMDRNMDPIDGNSWNNYNKLG